MSWKKELFLKNRKFQVCLAIIVLIVLTGVIGPFMTLDPEEYTGDRYEPPSSKHLLGTETFGKDVLAQLVVGIRNSLMVGAIAGMLGLMIALAAGGLGAYIGGAPDEGINTIANIFLVLPSVPVLIVLSVAFKYRSLFIIAGIIAVLGWAGSARSLRSQVLSLKERDFVNLARISGKSNVEIVFKEIFPNMLSYVFTSFCWMFGGAITAEAGISLLGLGPSMAVTLGTMLHYALVNEAQIIGAWWWFLPPGLVLIVFTGTLLMMSSVIDDVFNPKLRGLV